MNTKLNNTTYQVKDILKLEKKNFYQAKIFWQKLDFNKRLRILLAARGIERKQLISLSNDSKKLIRKLTPDEFYYTVLELEPEETITILTLCSNKQLTYLLDLTGWIQDKLAPTRYEIWLPILLEIGAKRVKRWLITTDLETLTLLFNHWIQVTKYLISQDEQEPPDNLPEFTLDGVYFIEFRNQFSTSFVAQILTLLKNEIPERYYEILESILWELKSDITEDAARWRQGRLIDYGFPERLDAIKLWTRPEAGEAEWNNLTCQNKLENFPSPPPRSNTLLELLSPQHTISILANNLSNIAADALRAELTYIANCAIVSLRTELTVHKIVTKTIREGLGLVNLGLEILAQKQPGKISLKQAKTILERLPLTILARQGAQAIRKISQQAWTLVNKGWLKNLPTKLYLLGPPLSYWLIGLLAKQPRCYDPKLKENCDYRSFLGLTDLLQGEHCLKQAELWGEILYKTTSISHQDLLKLFNTSIWPDDPRQITLPTIIGTWFTRKCLGLKGFSAIPSKYLKKVATILQTEIKGPLAQELIKSCQKIETKTEITLAKNLLYNVLANLEEEYKLLKCQSKLDYRFITGIIIKK